MMFLLLSKKCIAKMFLCFGIPKVYFMILCLSITNSIFFGKGFRENHISKIRTPLSPNHSFEPCFKALITGSSSLERKRTRAPPPVQMYDISSLSPNYLVAVTLSPPPTTEYASECAIASHTALVPSSDSLSSNTPIGPLMKTVCA